MDHQAAHVTDVGNVRVQFERFDEPLPGLVFHRLPGMAGRLCIDAIWREGNPAPGLRRVVAEVLRDFAQDASGPIG